MMPDIRKTILLVVNDAEYALHEAEQIKARGFNVVTANSGETAVGMVENGPKIDLVIMGLDLGCGIDGIQAAEMILQNHDIPLLFLAGHLEPETIDKTEKLSHYGLILKSGGDAVLLSSINMAFRLHNTHVEIKNREQLLRESQEKFSKSFQLTPLSMAISLASDRRYIEINDAFLSLTGYSREEVIGRNSLELGLWMDAETKTHVNHEIATAGEAQDVPVRLRTKSGEIRDAIYSAAMVFLGGVPHVVAQVLDITERKRAEEALRESEEKYRALVENANEVIIVTQDGALKFANLRVSELFGYSLQEAVGRPFVEFIHPDDRYLVAERYRKRLEGQVSTVVYPFRTIHKDGSIRWAEINSVRIAWEGRPAIMSYLSDITERKRAEEALRESKERLELALIGGNLGFYDVDLQTGRGYTDERYLGMLGYAPGEIDLGCRANWEQQVHLDDRSFANYPLQSDLRGETLPYDEEYRMRHKSGEWVWVRDRAQITARGADGRPLRVTGLHEDITARKRAEEELRTSQRRLEMALVGGALGTYEHNLQTGETQVDARYLAMLGYAPGELDLANMDLWEQLIHPEDLAQARSPHVQVEYRMRHKDGHWIWVLDTGRVVEHDSLGHPLRMSGVHQNITERKQAEEALRESEAKYRLLADNMVDGVWLLDMNLKLIYCSPSSEKQSGFTLQEIMEMSPEQYFTPESLNVVAEAFLEEMPKVEADPDYNPILTLDLEFYKKDGTAFWAESKFSIVRDKHGKPVSILGLARDITERKQLEKALRESEAKYRSLVETAIEGVASIDLNGNLTFINDALCRMTGYSQDELLNKPFSGLLHPDDLPALMEAFLAGVAGSRTGPIIEFRGIPKTGQSIWLSTQPTAITIDGKAIGFNAILHDISERKQAEEALKEERNLFVAGPTVVFRWQPGLPWQVKYASPNVQELLGYPPEAFTSGSLSFADVIHPDDIDRLVQEHSNYDRQGRTHYEQEYRLQRSDGQTLWVHDFTRTVIVNGSRQDYGYVTDITERKRAEEALRESESSLQAILRSTADGLLAISRENRVLLANERFVEMWKIPQEVMTSKDDSVLLQYVLDQLIDPQGFLQKVQQLYASNEDSFDTLCFKDGRIFDRLSRPLMLGAELRGRVWSFRDITERKRAEEALRQSEEKHRQLIETMLDGVYRSSHEGKFLKVNPAMVKILGYANKEELLAIDIKSQLYFAPEDRERAEKLGEMGAFRLRKKDGSEIWVEDHGLVVVDDEGTVLYHEGILRDITERKQLEERIRQVRSDLLFAVSHDLKSPLQTLRQTQEMLNELAPGEGLARFQEYQQIWRRNLQRLERMINNLVDSQRGEEDHFPLLLAPCRLEEIVQRVVEDLTGYALALQVQFDLQLEPVPEGSCDEETITRVVENLLTNAVKFSPKGGRVEIRLGIEGNTLRLEVEDRGCGIPANEQDQLFQPFQRSRSAQHKGIPGTGLGLYVCRRIMEAHGGSISLQSTEGVGTIVTVTLPLRE